MSTCSKTPPTGQSNKIPTHPLIHPSTLPPIHHPDLDKFLPLCPDFVIELRSASDVLLDLQAKMQEYLENGLRLGWLINPRDQQVGIYRPNQTVEILDAPTEILASPVLPGLKLDLTKIL